MAKGVLIALSSPVSADREAAYNDWYKDVHGPEVTALPGIAAMTRFKAVAQAVPPAEKSAFGYLTMFDLDDVDLAMRSFAEKAGTFRMTDAVDPENILGIGFVEILSTRGPAE